MKRPFNGVNKIPPKYSTVFLYLTVDKNVLRRRLGVLEKLYSGNLYPIYYSLSECFAEVTLGDMVCCP